MLSHASGTYQGRTGTRTAPRFRNNPARTNQHPVQAWKTTRLPIHGAISEGVGRYGLAELGNVVSANRSIKRISVHGPSYKFLTKFSKYRSTAAASTDWQRHALAEGRWGSVTAATAAQRLPNIESSLRRSLGPFRLSPIEFSNGWARDPPGTAAGGVRICRSVTAHPDGRLTVRRQVRRQSA